MEKHSFDRRLAERLWQHEKTPRPEAWKRLEERLGRKEERRRIIPFWYYGVAASVVVLLLAGIWWWGQPDGNIQPQVVVQTQPKAPLPQQTVVPNPAGPHSAGPHLAGPHPVKPQTPQVILPEVAPASTELLAQRTSAPRATQKDATVKSTQVEVSDEAIETNVPAEVAAVELNPDKVVPGNEPANSLASQPPIAGIETPPAKATVLVVKLTGSEPEVETQSRKRSRFIRVFNQLKNAKNGEQVDWKEVGFNPNTVLARAEERLERSTEKVNQSYQNLKEKTNF